MGIEAEAVPFLTFLLLLSGWSIRDLTEISAVPAYNPDLGTCRVPRGCAELTCPETGSHSAFCPPFM